MREYTTHKNALGIRAPRNLRKKRVGISLSFTPRSLTVPTPNTWLGWIVSHTSPRILKHMQQTILEPLDGSTFPKLGVLWGKNSGTCPNSGLSPIWFQVQIKMLSVRGFQKWMAANFFHLAVHNMSCRKGRSKSSIGIKVQPWIDMGNSAEKYLPTSHTKPRGAF